MYGIALGGAIGLLFAPKRGSELRRQVADSAERMRRQATDLYGTASDTVTDVVQRGRRAIEAGSDAFVREATGTRPTGARPSTGTAHVPTGTTHGSTGTTHGSTGTAHMTGQGGGTGNSGTGRA